MSISKVTINRTVLSLILISFTLVIGFQNCSKEEFSTSSSSSGVDTYGTETQIYSLLAEADDLSARMVAAEDIVSASIDLDAVVVSRYQSLRTGLGFTGEEIKSDLKAQRSKIEDMIEVQGIPSNSNVVLDERDQLINLLSKARDYILSLNDVVLAGVLSDEILSVRTDFGQLYASLDERVSVLENKTADLEVAVGIIRDNQKNFVNITAFNTTIDEINKSIADNTLNVLDTVRLEMSAAEARMTADIKAISAQLETAGSGFQTLQEQASRICNFDSQGDPEDGKQVCTNASCVNDANYCLALTAINCNTLFPGNTAAVGQCEIFKSIVQNNTDRIDNLNDRVNHNTDALASVIKAGQLTAKALEDLRTELFSSNGQFNKVYSAIQNNGNQIVKLSGAVKDLGANVDSLNQWRLRMESVNLPAISRILIGDGKLADPNLTQAQIDEILAEGDVMTLINTNKNIIDTIKVKIDSGDIAGAGANLLNSVEFDHKFKHQLMTILGDSSSDASKKIIEISEGVFAMQAQEAGFINSQALADAQKEIEDRVARLETEHGISAEEENADDVTQSVSPLPSADAILGYAKFCHKPYQDQCRGNSARQTYTFPIYASREKTFKACHDNITKRRGQKRDMQSFYVRFGNSDNVKADQRSSYTLRSYVSPSRTPAGTVVTSMYKYLPSTRLSTTNGSQACSSSKCPVYTYNRKRICEGFVNFTHSDNDQGGQIKVDKRVAIANEADWEKSLNPVITVSDVPANVTAIAAACRNGVSNPICQSYIRQMQLDRSKYPLTEIP